MCLYVFFGIACQNSLHWPTRFYDIVSFKEKERAQLVPHVDGCTQGCPGEAFGVPTVAEHEISPERRCCV